MKSVRLIAVVAVLAIVGALMPAQAQFRFGPKLGVTVSELHFNSSTFDSNNRAGFTAGAMMEFTVPVAGWGFDASVMYVRRNSRWMTENGVSKDNRDYIDIPLNFKWKINIPLINSIVRPYLATGPSFSILTSRRSAEEAYRNRKFDTAWNFGFGAELFKKAQVGASYGLGLTKALKTVGATGTSNINGRNRYWTITAAYLF